MSEPKDSVDLNFGFGTTATDALNRSDIFVLNFFVEKKK